MDQEDPIATFFPGQDDVDLYSVLTLDSSASSDDIKKAYRRLALRYHPDKHTSSSEDVRAEAALKFQQIGFAYSVLSDDKRRSKYDRTGLTAESFVLEAGEDGWEAYFSELFDRVTKGKLDELKKEYQGSNEEIEDLKRTYVETGGSIEEIMNHIPHSTHEDESRFVSIISGLIRDGALPKLKLWETSTKDEKARLERKKQGEKEAVEAEELAKEIGVWDEFYGSGKPGKRKGKGKDKESKEEEDYSALQALILSKKKKMDGFLDGLAEKYSDPKTSTKRGKKRATNDPGASSKKAKTDAEPDIDDAEFEKLQQKLFADKTKASGKGGERKSTRSQRTRR